jgi:glutathione S-transferase
MTFMSELTILGAPASIYVWVVRMACAEKGAPYTLIPSMPHTAEIDAIHPFGKIPVMRHGEATLCESRAICAYVDRAFDGPPLVPHDAYAAARVEQWVSLFNTHIAPQCVLKYFIGYFFPPTPDGAPDRALIDGSLPAMRRQFAVLDAAAASTGCLVGDSFTLADIALLPMLHYLQRLPESRALLEETPHLQRYYDRHSRRQSYRRTLPETMPASFERALAAAQAA